MALDTASIWKALREVIDPELGVNIVDLGLVYEVQAGEDGHVEVVMTMTTPACPLGSYFRQVIPATLRSNVRGVDSVDVNIVWEPRWQPEMMSEQAKAILGWSQ